MSPHFVKFYSCGKHVMSSCRCAAKDKQEIHTNVRCPTCGPITPDGADKMLPTRQS